MRFGGLIAAIVFAAIAAVIVLKMSGGNKPTAAPADSGTQAVQTTNIYVARTPIPVGTTITTNMIAVQPWPSHLVIQGSNGFIQADTGAKVDGMIARASFQANEPIIGSKISNVNDPNFLAGALPKGMRVLTIQTNEIEGVAGFVFPGDYVDVILTRTVKKWTTPPNATGNGPQTLREENDAISETLLTNVKVLAVDQRASGSSATDKNGALIIPRSVSLMVSPTDAQRLRLGANKGTLTLALRSLADRESADPMTMTTAGDISQYQEQGSRSTGPAGGVLVIRGISSEEAPVVPNPAASMAAPVLLSPVAPVTQP